MYELGRGWDLLGEDQSNAWVPPEALEQPVDRYLLPLFCGADVKLVPVACWGRGDYAQSQEGY